MQKKKLTPLQIVGHVIHTAWLAVLAVIMAVLLFAANIILPGYARMIDAMLGYKKSWDNSKVQTDGLDLNYNTSDYDADTIGAAEKDLTDRINSEGVVLLKNDGGLPLAAGTTVSLFSANSNQNVGAGLMGGGSPLNTALAERGLNVNETMWNFYPQGAGSGYGLASGSISFGDAEDFRINECPLSALQSESGLLDSVQGTTPVYILKRVAGEGRDMPRSMYNHADNEEDKVRSYLEPDSTEREILQYLNDNFDNTVLIVNSNAALELDWLADYPNIKSVLYAPTIGASLADVLTGKVSPSGRTVDTFAADASASPAAQNFGDYAYYDENGTITKYNYVTYEEGVYVGYRYYETRYEDVILQQGNAGDYDYASEVVYPFGYGLSYTTFTWSNFKADWSGDTCTAQVTVTNNGDMAGKDVVELYVQSPYTDYDKANGVEKPAVELVGYGKTSELAPGSSEAVSVSFTKDQLKAYDANGAKTYILDAGDYYITAAKNAHDAINNVLAAKGKTTADGMTDNGDAAFTAVYTPANSDTDTTTYAADSRTGAAVTNHLDAAKGDAAYLTRSDWTGTFPEHDGEPSDVISTWGNEINGTDAEGKPASYQYKKTASAELLAQLDSSDSGNPTTEDTYSDTITYGAKNGLSLIDLRGKSYDDPMWNDLLDQLTDEDYYNIITCSGYGVPAIASVGKPFVIDADTASGLIYGGTGAMFPNMMTLAQTWNQDLAQEYGTMIGNEAVIGGCDGWYAPSMNIHRTPFSGRNGEYYSEDPFVSGMVASKEVYGAATKGLYAYIKHFAFNDQENHRGDRDGQFGAATWLNEQSAREIYLKPFEMCMKLDDVNLNYVEKQADGSYRNATTTIPAAMGVMTAFNRIGATWTGGSYALLTGILRTEWGFNGAVITDNANTGIFMGGQQMIEAGGDMKLTYEKNSARWDNYDKNDIETYHYAREALHHVLYTTANTKAMNGAMPGSVYKDGPQISTTVRMAVTILCTLLLILLAYRIFRVWKPSKRKLAKLEAKAAKKAARQEHA